MEACLVATNFSSESSYIHLPLSLVGFALGRQNVSALPMGLAQVQEVENIAVFMPAWTDVEALVRWVALLEGELVKAHRAREVAEEKVHDLSSSLAEGSR
jgi:hypothetical protein